MHAIVSGSDSLYYSNLLDLVRSIKDNIRGIDLDICIYDFGLAEWQLKELKPLVSGIVKPGWDVQYPFQDKIPEYKKYATVAPFTRKYFPGYETYVWLDADTWCQNDEGIRLLIRGAQKGRLAVISSTDRNYPSALSGGKVKALDNVPLLSGLRLSTSTYLANTIRRCYSRSLGNKLFFKPLLNAGVYALRADSPHWEIWEDSLRKARFTRPSSLSDQVPLNHAYYTSNFPVEFLPAWCNWMCNVRLPALDEQTGELVEPNLPHHPISILHLVNGTFRKIHALETIHSGRAVTTMLSYRGFLETRAALRDRLEDRAVA